MAEVTKPMSKGAIKAPVARIEQEPTPEVAVAPVEELDEATEVPAPEEAAPQETAAPADTTDAPQPVAASESTAPAADETPVEEIAQAPQHQDAVSKWLAKSFPGREHTVVGGLCGLALALLVFTIGLWHTLLVVGFVTCGAIVGAWLDGRWSPFGWVRRLLGRKR